MTLRMGLEDGAFLKTDMGNVNKRVRNGQKDNVADLTYSIRDVLKVTCDMRS